MHKNIEQRNALERQAEQLLRGCRRIGCVHAVLQTGGCAAGNTHRDIIVALSGREGCRDAQISEGGTTVRVIFDGVKVTYTQ